MSEAKRIVNSVKIKSLQQELEEGDRGFLSLGIIFIIYGSLRLFYQWVIADDSLLKIGLLFGVAIFYFVLWRSYSKSKFMISSIAVVWYYAHTCAEFMLGLNAHNIYEIYGIVGLSSFFASIVPYCYILVRMVGAAYFIKNIILVKKLKSLQE